MVHQRNNSHGLKLNLMQSLFFDPEKGKWIKNTFSRVLLLSSSLKKCKQG